MKGHRFEVTEGVKRNSTKTLLDIPKYRITAEVSDLNYEIEDRNNKKQVVQVNKLKQAYTFDVCKTRAKQKVLKKPIRKTPTHTRGR
jgi:hypothetical protein